MKKHGNNEANTEPPADRLIDFRQVNALVGSKCKTSHIAIRMAAVGQIRAVRLNSRTLRYSERSVLSFIAGGTAR